MIGLVTVGNHHFEQIKVVFENVKVIQSESTSLKLIIIQPLGGKTNKLLPSVFWSVDVKVLCGITQEELFASFEFESSNFMIKSCISVRGY